jgi:tetratricopeptide (TPR) repeat protein
MTGASRDNTSAGWDFGGTASRPARPTGRLDTWKEIGGFLGCDGRTAKRWEVARGLPVHRIPGAGRSKVYAFADELTAWLNSAGPETAEEIGETDPRSTEPAPDEPARAAVAPRRWMAIATGGLAVVVLLASGAVLLAGRGPLAVSKTPSAEAVQFYQAGLNNWNTRTPNGLHMAVDDFTQAIVRDPQYAEAYVGLANCYNLLREYTNMSPSEAYPRAKAAALQAIALNDKLAGAHLAFGFEQFYWEWNTAVAAREFRRAIALDPTSALAHHWYANFDLHLGKYNEALSEISRAQALDPLSTSILADKARILYSAGHKQDAIDLLQSLERSNPGNLSPHNYLADIYLEQDDVVDYLSEMHISAELLQDATRAQVLTAAEQGWRAGGEHGMLAAVLKTQLDLKARGLVSNFAVARSYARLGDTENAFRSLAASQAAHEPDFVAVKVDGVFSALRGSPRFSALARRFDV